MTWDIYGDASTGSTHREQGQPCADFVGHASLENAALAVVVDGAGSVPGSALFARALKERVLTRFDETFSKMAQPGSEAAYLSALYRALKSDTQLMDETPGDATLLLLLLAEKTGAFLQVGDGFCVVRGGGDLMLLSDAHSGDYVNETDFVKSVAQPTVRAFDSEAIDFFALSSDGLTHVVIDQATQKPHAPFFNPFISFLESGPGEEAVHAELHSFLRSDALHDKVKDDVSLILGKKRYD